MKIFLIKNNRLAKTHVTIHIGIALFFQLNFTLTFDISCTMGLNSIFFFKWGLYDFLFSLYRTSLNNQLLIFNQGTKNMTKTEPSVVLVKFSQEECVKTFNFELFRFLSLKNHKNVSF